ncbi:hypothetical protein PgNI_10862 [Pyricularia grisea]|uniref:Uncharacterized protein n=1 Tax=Pyricularia grisea TaxID=148305 RepID=A0A6P8AZR2_PYRGI|nr:hypothetical protein PgNI_10862 [Pyricularia grisea]TLD07883.1 hypothetical protein PgNI_10862 [Pyricularia grisea]
MRPSKLLEGLALAASVVPTTIAAPSSGKSLRIDSGGSRTFVPPAAVAGTSHIRHENPTNEATQPAAGAKRHEINRRADNNQNMRLIQSCLDGSADFSVTTLEQLVAGVEGQLRRPVLERILHLIRLKKDEANAVKECADRIISASGNQNQQPGSSSRSQPTHPGHQIDRRSSDGPGPIKYTSVDQLPDRFKKMPKPCDCDDCKNSKADGKLPHDLYHSLEAMSPKERKQVLDQKRAEEKAALDFLTEHLSKKPTQTQSKWPKFPKWGRSSGNRRRRSLDGGDALLEASRISKRVDSRAWVKQCFPLLGKSKADSRSKTRNHGSAEHKEWEPVPEGTLEKKLEECKETLGEYEQFVNGAHAKLQQQTQHPEKSSNHEARPSRRLYKSSSSPYPRRGPGNPSLPNWESDTEVDSRYNGY